MARNLTGPTVRRRNPADSTLRNVRAANKRIAALERAVRTLTRQVERITRERPRRSSR